MQHLAELSGQIESKLPYRVTELVTETTK